MDNDRIKYLKKNLRIAEIKRELINEAISARLLSGKVTSDQLADYAEVLCCVENSVSYEKESLEKVLIEEQQASESEEMVAEAKEGRNDNNK